MASVWAELKRRNVVKVAVAYAIVGWLLVEVASTVLPTFEAPQWVLQTVTFVIVLGFPLALILAWAFELTPEGIKREKDVDRSASITHRTGRKLDFLIIGVLGIAVIYFVSEKFFWSEEGPTLKPAVTGQSVAVLPFVDMSPNKDQEYFSDGIAEELLNQLSKIRGLQVPGRTSTFAFKGQNADFRVIGEKLHVAHILEGSIRKAGERVRITVQLVKAADGFHLWSQTYDRDLTDIFAIQEEIAKAVAKALSITLGVGEGDLGVAGTRDFAAYDAYLAGLSLFRQVTSDGTVQAMEYLEKAVALDADYAQAWSVLALTYDVAARIFIAEQTEELYKKSEAAAMRAVEIAPEAVAPHVAAAQAQSRNREWGQAEQSFKRAIELSPADYEANDYYGLFLLNVGRPGDAIAHFRQAARTESLLVDPVNGLAIAHELDGDFDLALQEFERGEDLIGNQALRLLSAAVLGMETGDRALMEETLEKATVAEGLSDENTALNGTMLRLLDAPDGAKSELHRFYEDPAFGVPADRAGTAVWASYFGDPELALMIYRELFERSPALVFVIWRPIEKEIRRLPGFKNLVRNLGLVDYWRSTGNWGQFCRPVGHADFECE
jgi:TolB-like protein/Tfp pilus assembly protein PilF